MPRRKGRKGRKKKKGKKMKKSFELHPPPLHDLTKLYNQLMEKIKHLSKMRLMARDKRIEAWFITREMADVKSDNQIYRDYLEDNIGDLEEIIIKIMDLLEKERAELQKEIARLVGVLEKRHAAILKRTEEVMAEMERVRMELSQFEPLMGKLAKLLARLEALAKEIEAAELEADIKTRHLKNQFLWERAKLHNHLEKQLFDLIENLRTFIMPLLWQHMRKQQHVNTCTRWKLAKADATNTILAEQRDDLVKRHRLLNIEKQYLGIDWAFLKLNEVQAAKKQKRIAETVETKSELSTEPPTELSVAFNAYLKKRLAAYHQAKKRGLPIRGLQRPSEDAAKKGLLDGEFPGEDEDADMWEDIGEDEGEGYEDFWVTGLGAYKRGKMLRYTRAGHLRSSYTSEEGDEATEEEEEDESSGESTVVLNPNAVVRFKTKA